MTSGNFLLPVGISFRGGVPGHATWIDPTQFESLAGGTQIHVAAGQTGTFDQFYHRLDAGYNGAIWNFANFSLPVNIASGIGGTVKVQYLIDIAEYDITTDAGRVSVDSGLNGIYLDEAGLQSQPNAVGRFRYLKFEFAVASGEDPTITESGFTQHVCVPNKTFVPIRIQLDPACVVPRRLELNSGSTESLDLSFSLGGLPYNITGATIVLRAHRSSSTNASILDLPDIPATIVDEEAGIAVLTIPASATSSLSGDYMGSIVLTESSGDVHKFPITISVIPLL